MVSFQKSDHKVLPNQFIPLEMINDKNEGIFFLLSVDLNVNPTIWIISPLFNMTS